MTNPDQPKKAESDLLTRTERAARLAELDLLEEVREALTPAHARALALLAALEGGVA